VEETEMANSTFWTAFYAGVAAPVSLFAATPSYDGYVLELQPAQCFSIVGAYLTQAMPEVIHDRRDTAERAA
jgi:hypothetical protein